MKIHSAIKKETLHVAIGVLLGDAALIAVYALLKKLELPVILGALLGSAAAVGNFFVMGYMVQKALNNTERTKAIVQRSYALRMVAMVAVMIIGIVVPCFEPIAVMVPFLMPGITIQVMRLLGMYKPQEKGGEEHIES